MHDQDLVQEPENNSSVAAPLYSKLPALDPLL